MSISKAPLEIVNFMMKDYCSSICIRVKFGRHSHGVYESNSAHHFFDEISKPTEDHALEVSHHVVTSVVGIYRLPIHETEYFFA
jgi:hypothetical protein